MRIGIVIAVLLLLPELMSGAQRASQPARIYGLGVQTCGAWTSGTEVPPTDNRRYNEHTSRHSWVFGFVSGAGVSGIDLAETDGHAIVKWMDNYCREHPLDKVVDASEMLVVELAKRR